MENNGFKLVYSIDELGKLLLIEHPEKGRIVYSVGSIITESICPATGQKLQVGWLCYYPPVNLSLQPIGEFAVRQLIGGYAAPKQ